MLNTRSHKRANGAKNRNNSRKSPKAWGPSEAHSATKTATRISPDELDVKLMYRRVDKLDNGAGGIAVKVFHSNGAYDVDPSLGSTETYGFDEYASLYTYYRVIGYSYTITVVNQDSNPLMAYVLNTNTDPTIAGSSFYLYSTNPHCQSKLISMVSPNMTTFRGRHSIAQIAGTTAIETADSYRATVSAIPSDLTWLTVAVESIGGATVASTFDIKLIMHVRFYSREVDLTLGALAFRINRLVTERDDYQFKKKQNLLRQASKGKLEKPDRPAMPKL